MSSKAELRAEFRRRLAALKADELSDTCRLLEQRVVEWCGQLPPAQTIALFGGLRAEPDLAANSADGIRSLGHRTALFAIEDGARGGMEAWLMEPARLMRRGFAGVWEPDTEAGTRLDPKEVHVILVPGLFFCPQSGARLGRGGGFFDRYLARAAGARKIGVVCEWQLREDLPFEAHDQKMDGLLTEKRWIEITK